ncbi:potassium channel family protein [Simkania negevensis]|uniref:Protein lctB n=1 Tax=Simkania negevensis (strain ATCC VR-1471 / DSM 27360 / Z) TaxID=331113 RepID=F8L5E9_SIMNZ|nr:potassium channel family protein [Simkania negevensis]CCB89256.1 protein lctB [Simkania negevensis Z]
MTKLIKLYTSKTFRVLSGYFSQLLLSLILLFVFRPYDRGLIYSSIWQFVFLVVFLSAIFNCKHSRKVKIAASCFAIPALVFHFLHLAFPSTTFIIIFLVFVIIFTFIITTSIINQVVVNARVRLETLKGVVCAYFMVAFGFAFIYYLLDLVSPGTFHADFFQAETISHSRYLSEMMYFSFVTLLTIGYGDIIAVKDVGQTFTILEGIIGQFYIAILVSRLVAVYSFFEHKLHLVAKSDAKKDPNG